MITEDQADRIRNGWAQAIAVPEQTASAFYRHLFQNDPSTRELFKGDMEVQGRKLVNTLAFVIDHIDEPEDVLPAAVDLAQRHVAYGVTAEQYDTVGASLLAALSDLLGDGFSPEDAEAWGAFYGWLSKEMVQVAYGK